MKRPAPVDENRDGQIEVGTGPEGQADMKAEDIKDESPESGGRKRAPAIEEEVSEEVMDPPALEKRRADDAGLAPPVNEMRQRLYDDDGLEAGSVAPQRHPG